MKDKIKLRVLVKNVTIVQEKRWSDPEYTVGKKEVLQVWDNGWKDIPKEYDDIWIEKNR